MVSWLGASGANQPQGGVPQSRAEIAFRSGDPGLRRKVMRDKRDQRGLDSRCQAGADSCICYRGREDRIDRSTAVCLVERAACRMADLERAGSGLFSDAVESTAVYEIGNDRQNVHV